MKKYIVLSLLAVLSVFLLAGCSKKKYELFTYTDNDDDTCSITGLTDAGKECSVISIPDSYDGRKIISIENEVFRDDNNLTSVTISDGIVKIGDNAFLNCTSLSKIEIPKTVENIGTNAFENTIWKKNSLENSNEIVINGILICVGKTGSSYRIPDGVKVISSGVFYRNTELIDVICDEQLEIIGNYAFSGCSNLVDVHFSPNVRKIGYGAFCDCSSLIVSVPKSVNDIGQDAFANIKQLN